VPLADLRDVVVFVDVHGAALKYANSGVTIFF
jgi:hypothetical protein